MNYKEAINFIEHEIRRKEYEIEKSKECIKYLQNESISNDEMTQSSEQINELGKKLESTQEKVDYLLLLALLE